LKHFDQFRLKWFDFIHNKLRNALLRDYGVLPRYPAELELEENDGKTAIRYATQVSDYIQRRLPKGENT